MDWRRQAARQRNLAHWARQWAALYEARAAAYENRARLCDGTAAGGRVSRTIRGPSVYPPAMDQGGAELDAPEPEALVPAPARQPPANRRDRRLDHDSTP